MSLAMVRMASAKLVGFFYVGSGLLPEYRYSRVGYVMLGAFAIMIWRGRERLDRFFLLLMLSWAALCVLSIVRVPKAADLVAEHVEGTTIVKHEFVVMLGAQRLPAVTLKN